MDISSEIEMAIAVDSNIISPNIVCKHKTKPPESYRGI